MWNTPDGVRALTGPLLALLAMSAASLRDMVLFPIDPAAPDLDWHSGVDLFDRLERHERVFALGYVLEHLARPDLEPPDLVAWNEAALAAIFHHIETQIDCEISLEDDPGQPCNPRFAFRRAVRAALRAAAPPVQPPRMRCRDLGEWRDAIEVLFGGLFWDQDYDLEPEFADTDPVVAHYWRERLGIVDDYFANPLPRVTEDLFRRADAIIQQQYEAGRPRRR